MANFCIDGSNIFFLETFIQHSTAHFQNYFLFEMVNNCYIKTSKLYYVVKMTNGLLWQSPILLIINYILISGLIRLIFKFYFYYYFFTVFLMLWNDKSWKLKLNWIEFITNISCFIKCTYVSIDVYEYTLNPLYHSLISASSYFVFLVR